MRGAWIEIRPYSIRYNILQVSHPVRGAWIEIATLGAKKYAYTGRTP